jgi:hypothetical protein
LDTELLINTSKPGYYLIKKIIMAKYSAILEVLNELFYNPYELEEIETDIGSDYSDD